MGMVLRTLTIPNHPPCVEQSRVFRSIPPLSQRATLLRELLHIGRLVIHGIRAC